jgi:BirA family transcriptional regulator, biotin operon repressor / biotin---[acetyl-CoA-carboxylase] ligase
VVPTSTHTILFNKKISSLPIGEIRYFESIGSTNDEALAWAAKGAPDLSLVIADEQTAGRGRLNRKWFTPKGTALAISLIVRPSGRAPLSRTVGLAALSITDSLLKHGLTSQIKWPNDILLNGRKAAGILIETVWSGTDVDSLVIGMGINVGRESVPPLEELQFPATCIEDELGGPLDRKELLRDILSAFILRRPQMETDGFLQAWEELLAFRGEQVLIRSSDDHQFTGELLGLESDGSLHLRDEQGRPITVRFGDVSLRPAS